MIKEREQGSDVMKKHFNKDFVMTKKMMKILKTVQNAGFVVRNMLMVMFK